MTTYPVLYKLNELVPGNGYWAKISLHGRALVVEDAPNEWCAYGVNPGAIVGHGATIIEAFADIQGHFRRYLADQAEEAPDFAALRAEIERYFAECDAETQADWTVAVAAMKAGLSAPAGIARQDADSAFCGVEITELQTPSPRTDDIDNSVRIVA